MAGIARGWAVAPVLAWVLGGGVGGWGAEPPVIIRASDGLAENPLGGPHKGLAACNLFGEGFQERTTEVWFYRVSDAGVPGTVDRTVAQRPPSDAQAAKVLRVRPAVICCVIPTEGAMPVPTAVWVKTPAGVSRPYVINRPQLWWLSPDIASPGDRVRGFGRNLMGMNGRPHMFLRKAGGSSLISVEWSGGGIDGQLQKPSDYSLHYETSFRLPADLAPGDYEVIQHNGLGGQMGWSEAQRLTVRPREEEPPWRVSVKEFGAKGDGLADDTRALARAVEAAHKAGGGTVLLPAGVYLVTQTVVVYPRVSLKGEGMDASILRCAPHDRFTGGLPLPLEGGARDWEPYYKSFKPMIWVQSQSVLSDLAIDYNGLTQGCAVLIANPRANPSEDLKFIRVRGIHDTAARIWYARGRWASSPSSAQAIRNTRRTLVRECVNFGVWGMYNTEHYYGQALRNVNGSFGATGEYGTVEEENLIRNVFARRGFTHGTHYFCHRHAIHLRNRVEENFNSDGEAYVLEGAGARGKWAGHPTGADATRLTVEKANWKTGELKGYGIIVVKGRGMGQYRLVTDNDATSITIDRPWTVVPDRSSFVAVKALFIEVLFVDNYAYGTGGSDPFGNCVGCIWAGQRQKYSGHNVADACHWNAKNPADMQICYFNEMRDCLFEEPFVYWNGTLCTSRFGDAAPEVMTCVGNEFRNNRIDKGGLFASGWVSEQGPSWFGAIAVADRWLGKPGTSGWLPSDDRSPGPSQAFANLIAGNRVVRPGTGVGISITARIAETYVVHNRLEQCERPIIDYGTDTLVVE